MDTPNTALILDYESATATTTGGTAIEFRGKSAGGNLANYSQARIRSLGYSADNKHGLAFDVKPNAGAALTQAMTLNGSSCLGLGEDAGSTKLFVRTAVTDGDVTAVLVKNLSSVSTATKVSQDFNVDGSINVRLTAGRGGNANEGTFNILTSKSGTLSSSIYIDTTGQIGINTTAPTAKLDVNSDSIRLRTAKTPASATATGDAGTIAWDANFLYVCTATNTWKRAAIATW